MLLAFGLNHAHSLLITGHFLRASVAERLPLSPAAESADMNNGSNDPRPADHASSWFSSETDLIQKHASLVEVSFNNCRSISHKLADELLSNGIHAAVMRCSGLLTDAPTADQRWLDLGNQASWVHFVVQTDSHMVDLTRQQFFPLSDNPFLQTLNLFADEWTTIVADNFNSRMKPRLA